MNSWLTITPISSSIKNSRRVTALKATINGINVDLPFISPRQQEIFRAKKRKMTINSPSVTFLEHVKFPDEFIDHLKTSKYNYELFARENSDHLVNYSFNMHPDRDMSVEIRDTIREIQIETKSQFLFEHEIDINQNTNSMIGQLDQAQQWISKKKSSKILIPTIDMKISNEDLFLEKLYGLAEKFNRINVIYRSPNQAPAQWGYLQKFLKEKNIWCHMECIWDRYNRNKISHRASLYALGISSSSLSYGFGGGGNSSKPVIYDFNQSTLLYESLKEPYLPTVAEKYDRAWINSLNAEISQLQTMRDHVIKGTFYTNYISTKQNLQLYLKAFSP